MSLKCSWLNIRLAITQHCQFRLSPRPSSSHNSGTAPAPRGGICAAGGHTDPCLLAGLACSNAHLGVRSMVCSQESSRMLRCVVLQCSASCGCASAGAKCAGAVLRCIVLCCAALLCAPFVRAHVQVLASKPPGLQPYISSALWPASTSASALMHLLAQY